MARVLILDDDLASLAVAKRAVRAAGHDAITVTSAADASAALAARPRPDVLLASPSADAGEALALSERTRADPALSGTAVLLIGDASATGIPGVARPLDGPSVGTEIARALATRSTARAAPPPAPPAPPPPPWKSPAATAESALRALFRRRSRAPAEPTSSAADGVARRLATAIPPAPTAPFDLARVVSLARSADYFQVLGVSRAASATEIRDAADRLLAGLDARSLAAREDESTELREARQVVVDARDVLAEDALRAAYLKGIEDVADSTSS